MILLVCLAPTRFPPAKQKATPATLITTAAGKQPKTAEGPVFAARTGCDSDTRALTYIQGWERA